MELRPASELLAERKTRLAPDILGLDRAIRAIEIAHKNGWMEVSDFVFSPWVVTQLAKAGYQITYLPVVAPGDQPGHRISWGDL